ncbi:UDP-glucose dehydrogenase family protein [Neobacillus rhizophilus]|uniref:UDP-glucose 6-dehydrogenase n=1 Tax=Neobacillus rhizophilus TaxID=2833579 RepID=A0A942YVR7_9BACI|nr:UDP-glucose/GDP-mannose dehydrogenase family protein [Neobacillus rhizophilus]MBS4214379.1 UDP-glucose/GDP-mannose dehydrogenase family protein [Neobacillus rhizophilus]
MKITVAGAGYVGLVTSAGLAELGHQVTCIDIQREKIDLLQNNRLQIYEPGLRHLLAKNLQNGKLVFTVDPHLAYSNTEIIFIAVGTPEKSGGSVELKYIHEVAQQIAHFIENDVIICTKSTVPVGTNDLIKQIIENQKAPTLRAEVVANPEFLREGSAVHDFFHGDRIVIGTDNLEAASILKKVYQSLDIPVIITDIRSAEMIKYASNAFLATKISFINEIANICQKVGADIEEVAFGIGHDKRIGPDFLKAGIGYGGSCFPKDTKALLGIASGVEHHFDLLAAVINVNNFQQSLPVLMAKEAIGSLQGKKVALLGLAFKPETDDIRGSASLRIVNELLTEGAIVRAYDPAAIPNAQRVLGDTIEYAYDLRFALHEAELAIIATDWAQIKNAPLEVYPSFMKDPIIIDGRNCYSLKEIQKHSLTYLSIGRRCIFKDSLIDDKKILHFKEEGSYEDCHFH